ncbi:hypothetical protein FHG66_15260 [Rubellimicrobium rubrum]|uniref:Uncharacterized protein n=1 Tax=Rubellimicrobium rubrum TaxID=2585369 RepID=A0A5C4MVU9_9RHOB|nr:hypothetical protein [Rubellimicrobium rubrum]TNC47998.1 hypothetical protein FHG66_15260 [Rubellimicrobium rubrum]
MAIRWQEIVVIPEIEEDVICDCCGQPACSAEGRLVHNEAPLGRFSVRWRPGEPDHPARHVLYLGDWNRKGGMDDGPAVAAADYRGGENHGFYLRDDAAQLLQMLRPWRPHFIRRADAIGQPLGEVLFAMLDAIHVKDPRLQDIRSWAITP